MSGISCSTIKVNGVYNLEKVLKMLDWVFGHKSMESTSVLHQLDGVGLQGGHLGSFGKLNCVSVALVARSGIESETYAIPWQRHQKLDADVVKTSHEALQSPRKCT
ncbi:hypothetical protein Tco_0297647 [Tanacetum coccineum]